MARPLLKKKAISTSQRQPNAARHVPRCVAVCGPFGFKADASEQDLNLCCYGLPDIAEGVLIVCLFGEGARTRSDVAEL